MGWGIGKGGGTVEAALLTQLSVYNFCSVNKFHFAGVFHRHCGEMEKGLSLSIQSDCGWVVGDSPHYST